MLGKYKNNKIPNKYRMILLSNDEIINSKKLIQDFKENPKNYNTDGK